MVLVGERLGTVSRRLPAPQSPGSPGPDSPSVERRSNWPTSVAELGGSTGQTVAVLAASYRSPAVAVAPAVSHLRRLGHPGSPNSIASDPSPTRRPPAWSNPATSVPNTATRLRHFPVGGQSSPALPVHHPPPAAPSIGLAMRSAVRVMRSCREAAQGARPSPYNRTSDGQRNGRCPSPFFRRRKTRSKKIREHGSRGDSPRDSSTRCTGSTWPDSPARSASRPSPSPGPAAAPPVQWPPTLPAASVFPTIAARFPDDLRHPSSAAIVPASSTAGLCGNLPLRQRIACR